LGFVLQTKGWSLVLSAAYFWRESLAALPLLALCLADLDHLEEKASATACVLSRLAVENDVGPCLAHASIAPLLAVDDGLLLDGG